MERTPLASLAPPEPLCQTISFPTIFATIWAPSAAQKSSSHAGENLLVHFELRLRRDRDKLCIFLRIWTLSQPKKRFRSHLGFHLGRSRGSFRSYFGSFLSAKKHLGRKTCAGSDFGSRLGLFLEGFGHPRRLKNGAPVQARSKFCNSSSDRNSIYKFWPFGNHFWSFWELLGVIFAAWILRQIFVPLKIDF